MKLDKSVSSRTSTSHDDEEGVDVGCEGWRLRWETVNTTKGKGKENGG
jgi:hypothetical protein